MSLVYVITGFMCCIKVWVTIVWGSFPLTCSNRGSRVRLGLRGSSSPSLGSEHCGTLLLGSPSPWMLYFEQLVLSIIFVFLVNLSLSVYRLPLVYKLLYVCWDQRHHTKSRAGERTVPFGRRMEFT